MVGICRSDEGEILLTFEDSEGVLFTHDVSEEEAQFLLDGLAGLLSE